ncbi:MULTISPECIES: hypothetical protein [unclassified Pseudomonas]|uniref:hypothetical protein n=1 Tax=unclassified Pseudomonas TaxID=196821 RepID=UPI0025F87762|nr:MULTISPECIES: hypothetical protein [unclassified Pseudomonas]
MAVPQIDLLPPPALPTDPEDVFDAKVGASLTAEQNMVPQINTALTWIGERVAAANDYSKQAAESASSAANSAMLADQSRASAQAIVAAAGNDLGLPSLAGNARRALAANPNEIGVSFQTQIKLISIEPLSVNSAGGAIALDVGANGVFNLTLTAAATLSFANLPALTAAESMVILVRISQGATAYALTWPSGVVWVSPGGVAPATPNAGKRSEFILTIEGATIYGRKGASN